MCPFNTAKKIKSTEKVVIFIEGGAAGGMLLHVFSYEKARKFAVLKAVVFCENVFRRRSD
jgi:protease II